LKFVKRIGAISLVQPVLMKASALHDGGQKLALLLQDAQIAQRTALDDQEIGEGASLEAAELAHLADDLGADQGGGPDDLDRLLHLRTDDKLAGLLALQLPQQVGAVGHRYAGAFADLERSKPTVDDKIVLGEHVRAHSVFGGAALHFVVGDEIGD